MNPSENELRAAEEAIVISGFAAAICDSLMQDVGPAQGEQSKSLRKLIGEMNGRMVCVIEAHGISIDEAGRRVEARAEEMTGRRMITVIQHLNGKEREVRQ